MSIPFEKSPFQECLPCYHANEQDGVVTCGCKACSGQLTQNICLNCEEYAPNRNTIDFRSKNLKTQWVREDDEHSWKYTCSNCHAAVPMNRYGVEEFTPYCPKCGKKMHDPEDPNVDVETGVYRHFKGSYYRVLGVAENSETKRKLVVYQALYGEQKIWARSLSMFIENVEDLKEHYRGPRFYQE